MKKRLLCFAITLITLAVTLFSTVAVFANEVSVSGGKTSIAFEASDISKFDLYTEFNHQPYIVDGKLYMWSLAEQKAIYNVDSFTDVEVEVDIGTVNKNGKFDSGILIQASSVGNDIGALTGWGVSIENGTETNFIKLHRWENKVWKGAKYEKSGVVLNQVNHLKVVVKSGVLYAYLNNSTTEEFSYNVGEVSGKVGFRCYYAPNYFTNFSVKGTCLPVDTAQLDSLIVEANAIDKDLLTASSKNALTSALENATSVKNSSSDQTVIDNAVNTLKTALKGVSYKHTYAELTALIGEADLITNNGQYTANSFNAMQGVKERCKALTESASEDDISYWYNRLKLRMDTLISYGN